MRDIRRAAIRVRLFVSSWLILAALMSMIRAADKPVAGRDDIAGARGVDEALQKLRAPLRESDPLAPREQLKSFRPQDGFAVDLIASEPRVRQPLYLTFDERGRMWVVQYVQYPFPAGLNVVEYDQYLRAKFDKVPPPPPNHFKGNDVISILEDTDGDGTFEKQKTFVEGLNIVTAALPGRGGVWVLNPPYLLFYPDENRDDVRDGDPEVHLSGFGLEDTHAVASSLTWGPDGWIYGAHGSTCTAKIKVEVPRPQSEIPDPQSIDFLGQCIWRYHPERHVFEIFAEGGGNTFGVAFDDEGRVYSGTNWGKYRGLHYVQGGYYLKAWGKHGPLTNPYAFGFFEHMPHTGNADRLTHTFEFYGGGLLGPKFDGRIIGPNPIQSRVSVSGVDPLGSTFQTYDASPLLTSEDGWFRPVDQKTGPDGALYLADLYEKRISHVDPRDNWHRATGRIWRIRPAGWTPGYRPFDVAGLPVAGLVELLGHQNRWHRATARRVLGDRDDAGVAPAVNDLLVHRTGRDALEALWALHEVGGFDERAAIGGLNHATPAVRAWTIRLLTDQAGQPLSDRVARELVELADREDHPEVRSQLASSAKRMAGGQAVPLIDQLVRRGADKTDPHIPLLLWWAVESKAVSHREQVLSVFATADVWREPLAREVILQRLARRYAADASPDNQRALVRLFNAAPGGAERKILLAGVNEAFAGGTIGQVIPEFAEILGRSGNTEIALRGGDAKTHERVLEFIRNDDATVKAQRIRYLELLGQVGRPEAAPVLLTVAETSRWHSVRIAALAALARFDDPFIGERIIGIYGNLPTDRGVRPAAIASLLTRPAWAAALVKAVRSGAIAKSEVSTDQVSQLRKFDGDALPVLTDEVFGPERQPTSEEKFREFERVRRVVLAAPGDAQAGKVLFSARCASCHTLFGEGGKVGPELTGYDRTNVDDMVMNVVDPSAYIREEYQTFGVRTKSGQTLVGIITARGPKQITIADSTGQVTTVAKADIKMEKALQTSTMPDGLLGGLSDKQLQNLFAHLGSKPPSPPK